MNALSPVEIDRKVETLIPEKPLLHPEQQKVIDLLEEYPATHFHMAGYYKYTGGPLTNFKSKALNRPFCFSCVAGWTAVANDSHPGHELDRLEIVAGLTSARAMGRMFSLIYGYDVIPKAECIALVRDIFLDVGA